MEYLGNEGIVLSILLSFQQKHTIAMLPRTTFGDSHWKPSRNNNFERSPHFGRNNNRDIVVMVLGLLLYQHNTLGPMADKHVTWEVHATGQWHVHA